MSYPIAQDNTTITLYLNVPFSNSYEDHPYCLDNPLLTPRFLDFKVTGTYLGQYYDAFKKLVINDNVNFNYDNQLNTEIEISLENANDLIFTDANYLKVHTQYKDYYYFVVGTKQKRNNIYRFELELDVIMTYGREIKESLKDKPLLTERKMCYRFETTDNDETSFLCKDITKTEQVLSSIKPNKVANVHKKQYSDEVYLVYQFSNTSTTDYTTIINHITLPFTTKIAPASGVLTINERVFDNSTNRIEITPRYTKYYNDNNIVSVKAIYDPDIISKISSLSFQDFTHDETNKTFKNDRYSDLQITITYENKERNPMSPSNIDGEPTYIYTGCELILERYYVEPQKDDITILNSITKPTITTIRSYQYEPKLWCYPVRNYVLKSSYSDGLNIMSNLIFTYPKQDYATTIKLKTFTTPYAGDTSVFTTYDFNIKEDFTSPFIDGEFSKMGIGGTPNYSLPTARNALDYFNQTNSSSFFTGKVFGAIAGIAKNPTPVGATLSIASAGADIIANYEDLSNTPESVSSFGNNFIGDYVKKIIQPYIVEYVCSDEVLNQLMDYFYNFGYVVNKECYFAKNENFNNDGLQEDNMLFARRIFNYIKLKENIVSKLNCNTSADGFIYHIPFIVKEKINEIFNKGIKLWNFNNFNFWNDASGTFNYNEINNYYLKSLLENMEI